MPKSTWNTAGAISGALLTGFFILPALGFGHTLQLAMLISLALAAAVAAMVPAQRRLALSGALAQVPPTSSIFPLAVKLRVDWRVARARADNDPQLAA